MLLLDNLVYNAVTEFIVTYDKNDDTDNVFVNFFFIVNVVSTLAVDVRRASTRETLMELPECVINNVSVSLMTGVDNSKESVSLNGILLVVRDPSMASATGSGEK